MSQVACVKCHRYMSKDARTFGNTVYLKCDSCGAVVSMAFFGGATELRECVKEAERLGGYNYETRTRYEDEIKNGKNL